MPVIPSQCLRAPVNIFTISRAFELRAACFRISKRSNPRHTIYSRRGNRALSLLAVLRCASSECVRSSFVRRCGRRRPDASLVIWGPVVEYLRRRKRTPSTSRSGRNHKAGGILGQLGKSHNTWWPGSSIPKCIITLKGPPNHSNSATIRSTFL